MKILSHVKRKSKLFYFKKIEGTKTKHGKGAECIWYDKKEQDTSAFKTNSQVQ